jgi:hypothetical protein
MARFEKPSDRQDVRRAAHVHLKGKPYGINEHFQPEVLKIRKDLLSVLFLIKQFTFNIKLISFKNRFQFPFSSFFVY